MNDFIEEFLPDQEISDSVSDSEENDSEYEITDIDESMKIELSMYNKSIQQEPHVCISEKCKSVNCKNFPICGRVVYNKCVYGAKEICMLCSAEYNICDDDPRPLTFTFEKIECAICFLEEIGVIFRNCEHYVCIECFSKYRIPYRMVETLNIEEFNNAIYIMRKKGDYAGYITKHKGHLKNCPFCGKST